MFIGGDSFEAGFWPVNGTMPRASKGKPALRYLTVNRESFVSDLFHLEKDERQLPKALTYSIEWTTNPATQAR